MYANAGLNTDNGKDSSNRMQNRTRHSVARQFLFPYSGEEALTPRQAARVLLAWAAAIPLVMACGTLLLAALLAVSWQEIAIDGLFTFLSGVFIFGGLGVLVVVTNNWSAHVRRARQAAGASNTSGVRHGSKR